MMRTALCAALVAVLVVYCESLERAAWIIGRRRAVALALAACAAYLAAVALIHSI